MKYFTSDFVDFFKDLAPNNHKDWFHEHKNRYENSVKKPFYSFLTDLIAEIHKHDKTVQVEAKDCVLRINRDMRFSKDKTPYNLRFGGFVSRGGRKDKSIPGIFLRFSPEEVGIMVGCYGISKEQLQNIRNYIQNDLEAFKKIYSETQLVEQFGNIRGEEHKRIPKEFQDSFKQEPLIAKKQFYLVATREVELIESDQLIEEIMKYWHIARPFNDYLMNAMQD